MLSKIKKWLKTGRKWKTPSAEKEEDRRPLQFLAFEQRLIFAIEDIALSENRSADDVAQELMRFAVYKRQSAESCLMKWRNLSDRQKQIAELTYFAYTNQQIADELAISLNTVKTHLKTILMQFDINSKSELRHLLADWVFVDGG